MAIILHTNLHLQPNQPKAPISPFQIRQLSTQSGPKWHCSNNFTMVRHVTSFPGAAIFGLFCINTKTPFSISLALTLSPDSPWVSFSLHFFSPPDYPQSCFPISPFPFHLFYFPFDHLTSQSHLSLLSLSVSRLSLYITHWFKTIHSLIQTNEL